MQKLSFIVFFFTLTFSSQLQAQRFELPKDIDSLGTAIKGQLYQQRNDAARGLGDEIERMWYDGTIALDEQKKIHDHLGKMLEKKLKPTPDFRTYFSAIYHAKVTEGLDTQKFGEYLNVATKVLNAYQPPLIKKFFSTSKAFFEHRALFYDKSNQLFASDDSYRFEFVAPEIIEEFQEEDYSEEEDWEEDYNEEEDWEEDSWDDQEDETEGGLISALMPEEISPVIEGPVIRFDQVTLNIVTKYDSVFLQNTKGALTINNHLFVGQGGQFDWPIEIKDSVASSEISAAFFEYHFNVKKPQLTAQKVLLTHNERLNESIEGIFEFRSVKHDSSQIFFPHFTSYNSNINIKGLGNDNISYNGGFSLKGHRIYSSSVLTEHAQVAYTDDTGKKFKTVAPVFEFGDSVIVSLKSATTIYNDDDSLYHPSVKFSFSTTDEQLVIQKNKGTYYNTPFYESFFNLNINADIIKWDVSTDSLYISLLGGRKELDAIFESVEHFDSLDFKYMSGTYPFNPINMLASYSRKNGEQFYLDDLAKKHKLNQNSLKAAMHHMKQTGFIKYNDGTGEINLKPKLHHYVKAYQAKKDYDDIIIKSRINIASNAVYDLKEKKMLIRGVKELYLSDPLNIKIEPDTSQIIMTGDRNFSFNGKIITDNFKYIGRKHEFDYDNFLIRLGHVDSIKLYVKKKNKIGRMTKVEVDNVLSPAGSEEPADVDGGSGTLYINRPDNKAGREKLPSYPKFDAQIGAVIRFDRKDVLNGVYGKGVYFKAPPFTVDSLNDSDPASLKFKGHFFSDGIFPPIEEKLHIMEDLSFGFNHQIPENGYSLFEGKGKYYGNIHLDKQGIRGSGKIDYLAATLEATDFVYYPDSVFTDDGISMEIREEEHNGVIFPQITSTNFDLHWLPKKDSMYLYNLQQPFQLYNQSASLDGRITMTSKGVYGKGSLVTRGSKITSKDYDFQHNQFSARHAQFELESDNPDKPILKGDDIKLKFNLEENYADISPEVEGVAALKFPYAQMNTSITNARWQLNEEKVFMRKPKDAPLKSSYFYTVNKELDSLSFYATAAEYDMNTLEMKVSGIPNIIVADAKITPENGEILIHENSRIGQLTNTTIILDTLSGYHRLYDGVINIISRNEFSGYATYQYVNALSDTFAIQMENFHLEKSLDPATSKTSFFSREKGQLYKQHSVANGSVIEEDNILISPGFYFTGDMILNANRPALKLDGYVKLDFKNQTHENNWVKYTSEGNQQAVVIRYEDGITEGSKKIEAGLHFSALDNSIYSNFLEGKKNIGDDDFFIPGGNLFFNNETNEFMIEDPAKAIGESFSGKVFAYNDETGDIRFEGPLYFFPTQKGADILASGSGKGNIKTNQYNINSFLSINFKAPPTAYQQMAEDIIQVIEYDDIPEGLGDPTELLYKLGDIVGDPITKAYEETSKQEYTPIAIMAKEVARPLVFADVNLKWSNPHRAFYSQGKLGMSNIISSDINASFDGFLEMKKDEAGSDVINIFIKASSDSWYFFGYEAGRLMLFSSNDNFNKYISSKSNSSKSKTGEFVFYPGSKAEVLDFINRFRREYYEIEELYDLGSSSEEETEDESGVTQEKTPEEEDDDGF